MYIFCTKTKSLLWNWLLKIQHFKCVHQVQLLKSHTFLKWSWTTKYKQFCKICTKTVDLSVSEFTSELTKWWVHTRYLNNLRILQIDRISYYALNQCSSTAGPQPGTGPWQQLYRVARGLRKLQYATRFH